jgi:sulfoxide reductase catalytic subunit YedY
MLIRRAPGFTSSDVTDETLYWGRREWIAGATAALALLPSEGAAVVPPGQPLQAARNEELSLREPPTKFEAAATYNNFYEFGVNKDDPSRLGHTLRPRPWTIHVDGLVHKPKTFDVDELIHLHPLEERVYGLRCVEAWSMVIPWIGFPLAALLRRVEPTGQAKYVEFTTLVDPSQFPAQRPGFC